MEHDNITIYYSAWDNETTGWYRAGVNSTSKEECGLAVAAVIKDIGCARDFNIYQHQAPLPENPRNEYTLIYLEDPRSENPMVKCPWCNHKGRLMDDFSYLKAGFNGIQEGAIDDLDMQECGQCKNYLYW